MFHVTCWIWVHLFWSIARGQRRLESKSCYALSMYLYDMARKSGYGLKINRVQPDHIHVLLYLKPSQTVDQMVAGFQRSSHTYLFDNGLCDNTFQWARGYHAFSVSRSTLDETIQYISEQRVHHRRMSTAEELALFRRLYEYPK